MSENMGGTFYGVGVGPGDPELLTLKAARILGAVDRLYCPVSARSEGSFAASILAPLGIPAHKFRRVALCMARERQTDIDTYAGVAAEITAELRAGRSVAWITEGDPLLYSTFLHVRAEILRQAPQTRVEIVPGVTSLQAAAARAGIAMAYQDEQVAIVPAAYGISQLPSLVARFATVFLLKVHGRIDELLDQLARLEVPVQTYYLEKVGTAEERLVTNLETLRGARLPYFSLVILRRHNGASHA